MNQTRYTARDLLNGSLLSARPGPIMTVAPMPAPPAGSRIDARAAAPVVLAGVVPGVASLGPDE